MASLVIGIASLIAWIVPGLGLLVSTAGMVLGTRGLKSASRVTATMGLAFCGIGMVASIIFWIMSIQIAHKDYGHVFEQFLHGTPSQKAPEILDKPASEKAASDATKPAKTRIYDPSLDLE